jgi:hypothetical protein
MMKGFASLEKDAHVQLQPVIYSQKFLQLRLSTGRTIALSSWT